MADIHDSKTRSFNMSCVKGKNTKPEMLVRRFLHLNGFRYKLHDNALPGKPDLVLPKYRTVIFVHGCFWHGHEGCNKSVLPKTRTEWWFDKINNNKRNDNKVEELLRMKWNIIVIWECQLKPDKIQLSLESIKDKIILFNT